MVLFELAGSGKFGSDRCASPRDGDKPSNVQTALAPTAAEGTEDCGISVLGPGGPGSDGKGTALAPTDRCAPHGDKPSNFQFALARLAPTAAEGTEDCGISVLGPGSDGKGTALAPTATEETEDCSGSDGKGLKVLDKLSDGKGFGKHELAMILGGVHAAEEIFGFLVGVPSSGSGRSLVTGSAQPGKGLCSCQRGKGKGVGLPPTAGTSLRIAFAAAEDCQHGGAPGGLLLKAVTAVTYASH